MQPDVITDAATVGGPSSGDFQVTAFNQMTDSEGMAVSGGFLEYVTLNDAIRTRAFPKGQGPVFVHGRTSGGKTLKSMRSITALCLDCDTYHDESILDVVRKTFAGHAYLLQWRRDGDLGIKWHVILPLAYPYSAESAQDQHTAFTHSEAALRLYSRALAVDLDLTQARVQQVLAPYNDRPMAGGETARAFQEAQDGLWLDLLSLLQANNCVPAPQIVLPSNGNLHKATAYGAAVMAAVEQDGLVRRKFADRWNIRCPNKSHVDGAASSTVLYPSGRIVCQHGSCQHLAQRLVVGMLTPEAQTLLIGAETLDAQNDLPQFHFVSMVEAKQALLAYLEPLEPVERKAKVARITTGSGKTEILMHYLTDYTAPRMDEETDALLPGRRAAMHFPTNALMQEFQDRLAAVSSEPVAVHRGVLSVLNEDGSGPACQKYVVAKRLQASGGSVHRYMCSKCEFADTCRAVATVKASRSTGASLHLVNHATGPGVIREIGDAGGTPNVVWDESPAWVSVDAFTEADVVELELLASTKTVVTLDSLGDSFPLSRAQQDALQSFAGYLRGILRGRWSIAGRAQYMATVGPMGTVSDLLRQAHLGLVQTAPITYPFDAMSERGKLRFLQGQSLMARVLNVCAKPSRFQVESDHKTVVVASLTAHAVQYAERGGLILDATANAAVLQALNPQTEILDIHVADHSGAERVWFLARGISKAGSIRDRSLVEQAIRSSLRTALRDLPPRDRGSLKILLVTHQDWIPWVTPLVASEWPTVQVDYHYFGNTRGYDRWFQAGFNAVFTVGDPFPNLAAAVATAALLDLDPAVYSQSAAEGELAQAHGRIRSVQAGRTEQKRRHWHCGSVAPFGWDRDRTLVTSLTERF